MSDNFPPLETSTMLERCAALSELAKARQDLELAQAAIGGVSVIAARELCWELPAHVNS